MEAFFYVCGPFLGLKQPLIDVKVGPLMSILEFL